jgi:hypothetical protein
MRFCAPSHPQNAINHHSLLHIIALSNSFFLADPITIDRRMTEEFEKTNPVFTLLRIAFGQFPYGSDTLFREFARSYFIYDEIPRSLEGKQGIPAFDFHGQFRKINGVSALDFIDTSFIAYALLKKEFAINADFTNQAKKKGLKLPEQKTVNKVLDILSADKFKFISRYEQMKSPNRLFRMYDFNPLLCYPLIKPCQGRQFATSHHDFFHSPLPDLIASRVSTGIFYEMYNAHSCENGNSFSEYFGHVFEHYVGTILHHFKPTRLFSEEDIRSIYPPSKGKAPDWILADESALVLIECKATRFSRTAQTLAGEQDINSSLKQIIKGLKQLASFRNACKTRIQELSIFHDYTEMLCVIVTHEPFHFVNTELFRDHINNLLACEKVAILDWTILSVNELEDLQPHIAEGFRMSSTLMDMRNRSCHTVVNQLASLSNKSFKDSFLYSKKSRMYSRLGID